MSELPFDPAEADQPGGMYDPAIEDDAQALYDQAQRARYPSAGDLRKHWADTPLYLKARYRRAIHARNEARKAAQT
jgi:hypothetical protein